MKNDKQKLDVFLCHASADKPKVRSLYRRLLREKNIEPWLDQAKLLPGQNWDLEIRKAVSKTDVILVCLSKQSTNKEGYVQKEIKLALDAADEKLEGEIFLIPLKLEVCEVPARLSAWQWLNYFEEGAYKSLLQSLQMRADHFGIKIGQENPKSELTPSLPRPLNKRKETNVDASKINSAYPESKKSHSILQNSILKEKATKRNIKNISNTTAATLRKSIATIASHVSASSKAPTAITESLAWFRRDFPESKQTAFVMMSFEETEPKKKIWAAIQDALKSMNIKALRADTKEYNSNLVDNVLTYLYGCTFGIAIFDRITSDLINPNVIFEVGYSIAIGKQVCLLKDKTLAHLPTDILGRLYTPFDPHNPSGTIPDKIKKWIKDRGFQKYQYEMLQFGKPVKQELDPNELDFYALSVQAQQPFSVEGYAETNGTQLKIYTSKAQEISPPVTGQGVFNRNYVGNKYYGGIWNIQPRESDSYLICISGGRGEYEITATEGAHGITVGSIEMGQERTGELKRLQFNRWSIDLTHAVGSRINIELSASSHDTRLELFGIDSELLDVIGAVKRGGKRYTAAIRYEVTTPGVYMVSILNGNGPYSLRVNRH
jgi:hypothetical protein